MSLQRKGASSFWVPQYYTKIDCPALLGNPQISQSARIWPPPRGVPFVFASDFTRGDVAIFSRYESGHRDMDNEDNVSDPQSRRCRMWHQDSVKDLQRIVRTMDREPLRWPAFDHEFIGYDSDELNSTSRLVASIKDAIPLLGSAYGGHWLVLGSRTPFVEAILLETGVASHITTLEYANLSACPDLHPMISPVLPREFCRGYLGEERFDGFLQWSSVEHSGLGMYGDEINPWGDRQVIAQLWCRGKPGAWMLFGPGPEGPGGSVYGRELHNENRSGSHSGSNFEEKLFWNAGRDYGQDMFGRLMLNWQLVRPASSTWDLNVFKKVEFSDTIPQAHWS